MQETTESGTPAAANPAQNATPAPSPAPAATPPPVAPPAPAPPRAPKPPIQGTRSYTGAVIIMPRDYDEVQRIAALFAASGDMVPKDFRQNVAACSMAIMWGMELGVSPIQAIQGIAVIRGRPSVWGDLLLALVYRHPDFDDILEEEIKDGTTVVGARCTVWRKGRSRARVQEFTMAMALKAGLLPAKEDAAWTKYTDRMLKMRARSWCLRDEFPDAVRGMAVVEELMLSGHTIEGEFREVPATAAPEPIREPRERATPAPAAAQVEHEPNPLNELARVQIREATPDLAKLVGDEVPRTASGEVSFSDLDDLGPSSSSPPLQQTTATEEKASGHSGGELFPTSAPAPTLQRIPLSKGGRQLLDVYLEAAAPFGITEQNLIDELGDVVHGGNLQHAQDVLQRWIERKGMA